MSVAELVVRSETVILVMVGGVVSLGAGGGAATGAFREIVVPVLAPEISVLLLALMTWPLAKVTAAVPLSVRALKVTEAMVWLPLTAGNAPRSTLTEPPPPELAATIEKALDELILINCS